MTELICKNIYFGKTGQNTSKIQEKRGKIMYDKEKGVLQTMSLS